MKPENEGYSQCVERSRNHRSNSFVPIFQFTIPSTISTNCISQLWILVAGTNNATVGYILIDANGGLNQMRMGVRTHTSINPYIIIFFSRTHLGVCFIKRKIPT
jgi:hypothetical protein